MLKACQICLLIGLLGLASCTQAPDNSSGNRAQQGKERWYTEQQLTKGEQVYTTHCIGCHKEKASGIKAWKKALPDGSYPPPPLNGTAHAWHHSIAALTTTINEGGKPFGGKMPAFKQVLNDSEKLAVIAYFQSFWSEEIYKRWLKINQPKS